MVLFQILDLRSDSDRKKASGVWAGKVCLVIVMNNFHAVTADVQRKLIFEKLRIA